MRPTVGPKFDDEVKDLTFDFTDDLASADSLTSASVTVSTVRGADPAPSAILASSPVISGTYVVQRVSGGVRNVRYLIHVLANAAGGTAHAQEAEMNVL